MALVAESAKRAALEQSQTELAETQHICPGAQAASEMALVAESAKRAALEQSQTELAETQHTCPGAQVLCVANPSQLLSVDICATSTGVSTVFSAEADGAAVEIDCDFEAPKQEALNSMEKLKSSERIAVEKARLEALQEVEREAAK